MCLWDEKTRTIKNKDGQEIAAFNYGTVEPS